MEDRQMQFEDLEAWQLARQKVVAIYQLFDSEAIQPDFGLKGQITRAAVSVISNIAEGFERLNLKKRKATSTTVPEPTTEKPDHCFMSWLMFILPTPNPLSRLSNSRSKLANLSLG